MIARPARILVPILAVLLVPDSLIAQSTGERGQLVPEAAELRPADRPAALLAPSAATVLTGPLAESPVPITAWNLEAGSAASARVQSRASGVTLLATGATLLIAGSLIDGSAGTVVMVTGAVFAAIGVYRLV